MEDSDHPISHTFSRSHSDTKTISDARSNSDSRPNSGSDSSTTSTSSIPSGVDFVSLRDDLLAAIPSTEHRVDLSFHLRCFYGSDAVSSLLNNNLVRTAEEAKFVLQNLLDEGLMRAVHEADPNFQVLVLYYFVGKRDIAVKPRNLQTMRTHSAGNIFLQDYRRLYEEKRTKSFDQNSNIMETASEDEEEESKTPYTPPVITDFDGSVIENNEQNGSQTNEVKLMVISMLDPPSSLRGFRETHYYVQVSFTNRSGEVEYKSTRPLVKQSTSMVTWMEHLNLGSLDRSAMIEIKLMILHRHVPDEEMGKTCISVGELAARPSKDLVLTASNDTVVSKQENSEMLTLIRVSCSVPETWPSPTLRPGEKTFAKHLFIMTRGTRGDVQPFVALARALANTYNWMITICTELRYKKFVKDHGRDLKRGCIRFRISGGDTQKRVESNVAKWAINFDSALMQHFMMGFSESEFFDSEPTIFHWVKEMKPDYLMFGFTMAHTAMIISQALEIPLLGLCLQPTCIPSSQYPPLHFNNRSKRLGHFLAAMSQQITNHFRHTTLTSIKTFLETMFGNLNTMRKRRGLLPFSIYAFDAFQNSAWMHLQNQNVPIIVPINQYSFGGKPKDWGANSVFTNYLFLRGETVPQLQEHFKRFIQNARLLADGKIVALAFSSMPVDRSVILQIAVNLIRNCEKRVCVIALIGEQSNSPGTDDELEMEVFNLQKEGRILIDKGAPYGRLFPLMDLNITHGGLGSSAEALMAGVPVIVTGVLLFDQRFWGRRCDQLGVGPRPVHISKFKEGSVELVDEALGDGSKWAENAVLVGKRISETLLGDATGVQVNARTVFNMAKTAPVFSYDGGKADNHFYHKYRSLRQIYQRGKETTTQVVDASKRNHAKGLNEGNIITRTTNMAVGYFWKTVHWSVFVATKTRSYIRISS